MRYAAPSWDKQAISASTALPLKEVMVLLTRSREKHPTNDDGRNIYFFRSRFNALENE